MGLAFRAWQIFTSIAAETRLMPFFVFLDLLECDVDFRCQQLVADHNDPRPPADFVVHRSAPSFCSVRPHPLFTKTADALHVRRGAWQGY
ncbi:hypothetical protein QN219_22840 [Sinorhizobium sp. 7-81]|uniref:hypothetical protein n=1 Tax=Sinorhizobium sp. 8-89 TaxID=3049089 RepID=UPI0024C2BFCC|nr:hypothetical protein [Sinorhizobium sp. 8-89]MDK1492862.1 hypothetical protein [Sinorhizobium sp. 8-89]